MNSARNKRHGGRFRTVALAAVLALAVRAPAQSDPGVVASQVAPIYLAGTTLDIACTFTYPTGRRLESLLWTPALPPGWALVSVMGDGGPELNPATGEIAFFGDLSGNPLEFSYRLRVPDDASGSTTLGAVVEYQLDDMPNPEIVSLVEVPLAEVAAEHSVAAGYLAGRRLEVTCTFSYRGERELESLLWEPELPEGWSLADVATGQGGPQVDPGRTYLTLFGDLSPNPVTFSYFVDVPPGAAGDAALRGRVEYKLNGMFNEDVVWALADPLTVREQHTLEVVSDLGTGVPPVGLYTNYHGTVLTNRIDAHVVVDSRTFSCAGWTLEGCEPASGVTNECVLALTNNAVLTWQWVAPLIDPAGSVSVTMDEDGSPSAWAQPPELAASVPGRPDLTTGLQWSVVEAPTNGVAHVTGAGPVPSITYTPRLDWFGADRFVLRVVDALGGSDTVAVIVDVLPVNDRPVLAPIGDRRTDEFTPLTFTVSATDVDLPPQTLVYSMTGAPAGALLDAATGVFSWTPSEGQAGVDFAQFSVTVTVTDNGVVPDNQSDSEMFTITLDSSRATHATVGYLAGQPLIIDCTFTYPANGRTLESLLWRPELPVGWTLVGASGHGNPQVDPADGALVLVGGDLSDHNPVVFQYVVNVPPGATGPQEIRGLIEYQLNDMPNFAELRAQPDPLVIPMLLTLPDLEVADKVYDGTTNATVVSYGLLAGVVSGHDVSLVTNSAVAFFDTPLVGSNKTVTVLGLALEGADASQYAIAAQTTTASIVRAVLTATADSQAKTYGDANPPLTFQYAGFVAGEGPLVLDTPPVASTWVTQTTGIGTHVGAISVAGGVDDNYRFVYVAGDFSVTPRTVRVTATAGQWKIYGAVDPVFAYTITSGGPLVGTDEFTGALARDAGEMVGNYAITRGDLALSANYILEYTGATFAITPLTVTVTATAGQQKTYGALDPVFAYTSAPAVGTVLANGLAVSFTGALDRAPGEAVGNYAIGRGTLTNANYTIAYTGATFEIAPKPASVTPAVGTKVYGTADPALMGTLAGFLPSDNVMATYNRTAGETVAGSPYTISAVLSPAGVLGNYDITYNTAAFTITKAPPIVTAWPVASNLLLGQTLGDAVLSGGAASVPGRFTFDAPGTVPGLGTASHAMTFTPDDSANYASVPGSVAVTVHVAPVLNEIGNKTVDELTELAFTATATDQDQPPQSLFYSLDAVSLAAGMTINTNTGAFVWTPSELQGPGSHTVTVTVTDGPAAATPVITPLVRQSFEGLTLGSSIDGVGGWAGAGATVVNDPPRPAGYTGALPLADPHTQTLQVTEPLTLSTNGTGTTTLDLMVRPTPGNEQPEVAAGAQTAFCFNPAGDLLVYHGTNTLSGYAKGWSVIPLADKVMYGEWVRLTLVTDYLTSDPPNPMFQLRIDGTLVSSPLAKQTADIDGTAGGTWFIGACGTTVGGGATQFNAMEVRGNCVLDDVVVTSETPPSGSGGGSAGGLSVSETFTITVNEVNLAPVANADSYSVVEGRVLTVPAKGVLANDTDADFPTNTLSAVLVTDPVNGSLTLNADGSFSYAHDGSETTSDSFVYKVFDGLTNSLPTTVSITVDPDNDAPYVTNALPNLVKPQDFEVFTIDLSSVFTDAEGNEPFVFSASVSNEVVLGAYVSGSTLTVTNFAGARGTATLTVTATETGPTPALSGSTSFNVLVAPVWNVTQNKVYTTIQAALDDANAGDEIRAAAGTYPEQVLVQKDVVLVGAGAGRTIIQAPETRQSLPGGTFGTPSTTDYLLATYSDGAPIRVKVTGFTLDANQAVSAFDRFTGVYFNNVVGGTLGDAGLFNCEVKNFNLADATSSGVFVSSSADCLFAGNRIGDAAWGLALDNGSTGNTIASNEVENCQLGIWIGNGSSDNTATRNLLVGNPLDVQVDTTGGGAAPSGLAFIENSFGGGFVNNTANGIFAETNWWGSAQGPTQASNPVGNGEVIVGPVDFSPWLGTGDEDPATGAEIGFQPILEPLYYIAPTCTLETKLTTYSGQAQSANEPQVVGGTYVVSNRVSGATGWTAGSSAIAAGSYDLLVAVTGDSNHSNQLFTFSSALVIDKAELTVTASPQTKTYGDPNPPLTFQYAGFLDGEGPLVLDTPPVASTWVTPTTGVGTNIAAITVSGGVDDNYSFVYVAGDFVVTPRTVRVTASAGQSKIYGAADPVFAYTITSGGPLVGTDEFTGALARDAGEMVGNYAITRGDLALSANYILEYTGAMFEITPLAVTVAATPGQSKTYGDVDPAFAYTSVPAVGSALANGGTISFVGALDRAPGETVGDYAIGLGTLANANYTIAYTPADFEITPLAVAVTATPGQSKTYGDADPAFAYTSVPAVGELLPNGLAVSFAGALDRALGETVGDYVIGLGTLANANFTIAYTPADFEIKPLAVAVAATPGQSKTYGDADPAFAYTSVPAVGSALANGGTISFVGALDRAPGETVGDYAIGLGTLANANYTIAYTPADFEIKPLAVTVTATPGQSKTYGDVDPAFAYTSAPAVGSALANGGTISFVGALDRALGETVGDYAIGLGTLANANYTIAYTPADFEIKPLAVTVTATPGQSKTYGDVDPAFAYTSAPAVGSALANGGTISFVGALDRALGETVGDYAIGLGTLANANYTIAYTPADFEIKPLAVAVAATPGQSKTYGDVDPAFAYTSAPAVGSALANGGTISFVGALDRAPGEAVSTYAIGLGSLANANFTIAYTPADFEIKPLAVAVAATPGQSKTYGDVDPVFAYTSVPAVGTALANGGTISFTGALDRAPGEAVGDYAIGLGTLANANYDITYTPADFEITPLAVAVAATPGQSKTYGDVDPAFAYASVPAVGTALANGLAVSFTGALDRAPGETVGDYAIGLGSLANANFTIAYTPADFEIKPLAVAVAATPGQSKTYGDADPVFAYTSAPAVGELLPNGLAVSFAGALDRALGETVGDYAIGLGTLANANFTIAYTSADFEITPRILTIGGSFEVSDKFYDGGTTATISLNELVLQTPVDGDDVVLNAVAAFDTKEVGTGKTVSLTASTGLVGADAGNYLLVLDGAPTSTASILFPAVAATESAVGGYRSPSVGATVITNSFNWPATATLTALTWMPILPAGWSVHAVAGPGAPTTDGTNIVFASAASAPRPLVFTYSLRIPGGAPASCVLNANVTFGLSSMGSDTLPVQAAPPLPLKKYHSSDYQTLFVRQVPNWKIDSFEASRTLKYYRTGTGHYHVTDVTPSTPDGYDVGANGVNPWFHSADYQTSPINRTPDGRIDAFEASRVLKYWRTGAGDYHSTDLTPATPDGYDTGP